MNKPTPVSEDGPFWIGLGVFLPNIPRPWQLVQWLQQVFGHYRLETTVKNGLFNWWNPCFPPKKNKVYILFFVGDKQVLARIFSKFLDIQSNGLVKYDQLGYWLLDLLKARSLETFGLFFVAKVNDSYLGFTKSQQVQQVFLPKVDSSEMPFFRQSVSHYL